MSKPSCSERPRPVRTLALWLTALPALAQAGLEMPQGGWRQAGPDTAFTREVRYPASLPGIDPDLPDQGQIRGRIARHAKGPATLIVNGNAMPLELDEDGRFGRSYLFGEGGNSIEVRSADGQERHRVQFHQRNAGQPQARLRVLLSWDSPGTDLDLHVILPDGQHAWYGNRVTRGGAIDLDVTTGYGPEIFASPAPQKGVYQVYVNYYGHGEPGEPLTTARITVIANEATPHERRQQFEVPMRAPGELTLVRQFVYP